MRASSVHFRGGDPGQCCMWNTARTAWCSTALREFAIRNVSMTLVVRTTHAVPPLCRSMTQVARGALRRISALDTGH